MAGRVEYFEAYMIGRGTFEAPTLGGLAMKIVNYYMSTPVVDFPGIHEVVLHCSDTQIPLNATALTKFENDVEYQMWKLGRRL